MSDKPVVGHGRDAEPGVWSEAAIEAAFKAAMHELLRRELSQEEGRTALATALVKVPEGKRAMLEALAHAGVRVKACAWCNGNGRVCANCDREPCRDESECVGAGSADCANCNPPDAIIAEPGVVVVGL